MSAGTVSASASVARVGIVVLICRLRTVGRVSRARVANKDLPCLDIVASTAVGGTGIDRVTVVYAATHGVALHDLDTHVDGGVYGLVRRCLIVSAWIDGT